MDKKAIFMNVNGKRMQRISPQLQKTQHAFFILKKNKCFLTNKSLCNKHQSLTKVIIPTYQSKIEK